MGNFSVDDGNFFGWPLTSDNTAKCWKSIKTILKDFRQKINDTCNTVGLHIGDRPAHFTGRNQYDAHGCIIYATSSDRWRKENLLHDRMDIQRQVRNTPDFVSNVISGDKSVYESDLKIKQLSQWKSPSSPRMKKPWQDWSNYPHRILPTWSDHQSNVLLWHPEVD